jgi:3-oxoadipate enol-lactonase
MTSVPRFGFGSVLADGAAIVVGGIGAAVARAVPDLAMLEQPPAGRLIDLPGRGETYLIDTPAPYPGAPTVVLLHGLACTAALNWASTFSALSEVARVVAFDLRWHGQGIDASEYALEDCADDVVAVLDELRIGAAVVVGYSLGGSVAQLVAYRHPSRVEGLVLCSTAGNWQGHLGERLFFPLWDRWFAQGTRPRAHAHVQQVRRGRVAASDAPSSSWASDEMRGISAWALGHAMNAVGNFSSDAWIGDLRVPTAVVVTVKDKAIPAERQHALAARIPGAVAYEAPGGHASVVLDARTWVPVFLEAIGDVAARRRVALAV